VQKGRQKRAQSLPRQVFSVVADPVRFRALLNNAAPLVNKARARAAPEAEKFQLN